MRGITETSTNEEAKTRDRAMRRTLRGVTWNSPDRPGKVLEAGSLNLLLGLFIDGDTLVVHVLLGSGFLILHVLGHEILQVRLGLGLDALARGESIDMALPAHEFELVHALSRVPMDESLSPVHGGELLSDTLEERLNRSRVADERRRHLETSRRDVALGRRDVSGDPLDKVARVFGLDRLKLVLDLLHRDLSSVDTVDGQVSLSTSARCAESWAAAYTMSRVRSGHHVLGVEHLLGELGDGDGSVRGRTSRGQGGESDHEEMQSGEGDHVDGQFSQIRVELTRESETGRDTGHDDRDEVVEVTVSRLVELEGSEADVVERLVVDAESLVRVLDELVDREGGVVRLDDSVRDLALLARVRCSSSTGLTFGEGMTEKVHIIRSGYSSRILEINSVPIPAPVPPPNE